jgi:leucyl-tRNA synthetase
MPRLGALVDLGEVNESQGAVALRRRLQRWCRTAVERVSENYEALQMHRAIRNVMTFLLRIEDFEQRAIDQHGELTPADRRALGEALLIAVQLIAPIAPHMGEELWRAAGGEGFVAGAAWPTV